MFTMITIEFIAQQRGSGVGCNFKPYDIPNALIDEYDVDVNNSRAWK